MMTKPVFWDYLIFYPYDDEPGYDGIHDGGIKGIKDDVPDDIKTAYNEWLNEQKKLESMGIKI